MFMEKSTNSKPKSTTTWSWATKPPQPTRLLASSETAQAWVALAAASEVEAAGEGVRRIGAHQADAVDVDLSQIPGLYDAKPAAQNCEWHPHPGIRVANPHT